MPRQVPKPEAPKTPREPQGRTTFPDAPRREGKVFYAPPVRQTEVLRQTEPVRQPEPVPVTEAVRPTDPAPMTQEEELAAEEAAVLKLLAAEPFEVKHHERFVRYAAKRGEQDLLVEGLFHMAIALRASGFEWRAKSTLARILSMEPNNTRALEALGYGKPGAESDPFLRSSEPPVRAASDAAPAPVVAKPAEPAPTIPSQLFETAATAEQRPEPAATPDEGYVDLAAMILDEPAEATTRWQVEYQEPAPNEEADFGEILAQFKQQVSQHLERSDARAHYDLGSAYKGMGLVQEAIAMFQKALRAEPDFLPAIEMLGRCFLDNGDIDAGINALKRGLAVTVPVEDDLLGIYYYLGNAHEMQGNREAAKDFYLRVFACDINFLDVTERLRGLR
jgi:tetratricopeptide (TPR) repeat protein